MENYYNKEISEINPINAQDYGYNPEEAIVKNREDLRKIIEEPCLPACLKLYDLNIQTVKSSANNGNIGDKAYIGINYDSLDENNKNILNNLINTGIVEPLNLSDAPNDRGGRDVTIKVPIYEKDTVGKVSDRFMQIASRFEQQDVLYGRHTHEDVLKIVSSIGSDVSLEDIVDAYGFIYDDELKIYWHNRELYNKHLQYQNKQINQTNETRKHDYQGE